MSNQVVNYRSVLEDLRSRRDKLNVAIEAIEGIVGEGTSDIFTVEASDVAPEDTYRKMTIGDAAVHFVRSSGQSQDTMDIVKALKLGGIQSKSKNLYTTVYNTLTDRLKRYKSDIYRDGTAWGLAEWKGSGED
jgi:hypothetical protein